MDNFSVYAYMWDSYIAVGGVWPGWRSMSITRCSMEFRRHLMVWPVVAVGGCGEGKFVREREGREI
jgi:hypothetical protein